MVQYLDSVPVGGSSVVDVPADQTLPGDQVNVYRITTRSETEGKAVRIVESTYTTGLK
ncbi:MAG: hypothetical protein IPG06_10730 [Haliea sp.]|nr:hypothetical protein [Haliea sp.]